MRLRAARYNDLDVRVDDVHYSKRHLGPIDPQRGRMVWNDGERPLFRYEGRRSALSRYGAVARRAGHKRLLFVLRRLQRFKPLHLLQKSELDHLPVHDDAADGNNRLEPNELPLLRYGGRIRGKHRRPQHMKTPDINDKCPCDKFKLDNGTSDYGRDYELCTGEFVNGRPPPSQPSLDAWRKSHGLPPLLLPELPPAIQPAPQLPPLVIRGLNFGAALWRHAMGGFEYRSQAEIEDRVEVCKKCDQFNGEHCLKCGCACNTHDQFLNKLAWKSEKCPEGKWQ